MSSRFLRLLSLRARFKSGLAVLLIISEPDGWPSRSTRGEASLVSSRDIGGELLKELVASRRLVVLSDRSGRRPQAAERAKEASVRLVAPGDPAGSTPPGLPDAIQTTVIAHAEVGIGPDRTTGGLGALPELGPGGQTGWVASRHGRHLVVRRRAAQRFQGAGWLVHSGFQWFVDRELHPRIVSGAVLPVMNLGRGARFRGPEVLPRGVRMIEAAVVVAQKGGEISFDPTLPGLLAVGAGVFILLMPRLLNYLVAAYLIVVGLIDLFNVQI